VVRGELSSARRMRRNFDTAGQMLGIMRTG
jgi:hypothetical protein